MPFINRATADKVVRYAIEKGINPEFLSMKVLPFVSDHIKRDINDYIGKSRYESKPSYTLSNKLILKNTLTQMMLKVRECDIENTENVLQTPKV